MKYSVWSSRAALRIVTILFFSLSINLCDRSLSLNS